MKNSVKKATFIILAISIFFLFFPYFYNAVVPFIAKKCENINCSLINISAWNDTVSVLAPMILSTVVILQSKNHQDDLKSINDRMLNLEEKSKLGYFLPYVFLKDAGIEGCDHSNYSHSIDKQVDIYNGGTDNVFIVSAFGKANGRKFEIPINEKLFVPNDGPFRKIHLECFLTKEELALDNIEVEFDLLLQNMLGYKYHQILRLNFEIINDYGIVKGFNMNIKDGKEKTA